MDLKIFNKTDGSHGSQQVKIHSPKEAAFYW